jgi:hypothetical protein
VPEILINSGRIVWVGSAKREIRRSRCAIDTKELSITHIYRGPGEYDPEAMVRDGNGAVTYTTHVIIAPEPSMIAAGLAQARRRVALLGVGAITILTASLSGLLLLYVGKPFGTFADYVVAVLWGFGTERAVAHASGRVRRLATL